MCVLSRILFRNGLVREMRGSWSATLIVLGRRRSGRLVAVRNSSRVSHRRWRMFLRGLVCMSTLWWMRLVGTVSIKSVRLIGLWLKFIKSFPSSAMLSITIMWLKTLKRRRNCTRKLYVGQNSPGVLSTCYWAFFCASARRTRSRTSLWCQIMGNWAKSWQGFKLNLATFCSMRRRFRDR